MTLWIPLTILKFSPPIIYAPLTFNISDLPDCSFLIFFLSPYLPLPVSLTYRCVPVFCSQPTCLKMWSLAWSHSHLIFQPVCWKVPNLFLQAFFPQSNNLYFQLSTGHIFPDVPQITPFQHVQNVTFTFTQVKLFLYKPTPLSVFPVSGNETIIPLSVQARNSGDIPVSFTSLTSYIQAIHRSFQHYLVKILRIYFLIFCPTATLLH